MYIVCIILGLASLAYFGLLISVGMDFAGIWVVIAAGFLILGLYLFYHKHHARVPYFPVWVRGIFAGILAVGLFVFLLVEGMIFIHMFDQGETGLNYIVVLGAQVRGEQPSKALVLRLETAMEYMEENPGTKAILSGGQGPGESVSEAEAMRRYLEEKGIAGERLIMENKSTSTVENLEYSAEKIGNKEEAVGIVTNNFHVSRALWIGKKQGYPSLSGIAAKSDPKFQIHYLVREFFALVKEKLAGNI